MAGYKQVIILRKGIEVGKGKLISQAIHAAIGAMRLTDEKTIKKWEKEGSKKVVLKINDLKELLDMHKKVRNENIPCFLVKDAGLTQLKKGTVTALGIGPIEAKTIDKITGKLKLF